MSRDEAQISLMSWNINGLKSKVAHFKGAHTYLDIVFLQETHIGPNATGVFENFVEWHHFYTVYKDDSKGVAILINKKIDFQHIESCNDQHGGYIIVKCKILNQLYTLVNVYNHTLERDILDKLLPYLQECTEGVLVIGGDFNTTLNPYMDRMPTTKYPLHVTMRNFVRRLMASLHLVDVWRRINPTEKQYTSSKMSRIDYIFMQEESMWRVNTCEILDPVEVSDHKPVCLQLTSTPSSHGPLPGIDESKKNLILNKKVDSSSGNSEPLIADIPWAARSLANLKPTGPDGIPVHFYRSNYSNLSGYFNVMYKQMLDNKMHDTLNHSIQSLDDRSYYFFNVDYLILTTILTWHLEKHLDVITQREKKKNEIKGLIVIHPGRIETVRWSLLKKAINNLENPILEPTIVHKLLRRSDQDQDQKFIQLLRGCPLTPALLKLYVIYLMLKVQTDKLFPSGLTIGILVYGESVMISFSFKKEEKLMVRQSLLEEAKQTFMSVSFDQLLRRLNQDEDEHKDEDEEEDEDEDEDQDQDQEHVQLCSEIPDDLVLLTLCVTHLMNKVRTPGRFFPTSMMVRNITDNEIVMISVSFE